MTTRTYEKVANVQVSTYLEPGIAQELDEVLKVDGYRGRAELLRALVTFYLEKRPRLAV